MDLFPMLDGRLFRVTGYLMDQFFVDYKFS